ncbi:MAG: lytic murein transglycosylase [Alphaproteobacteria bacterium]
MRQRLASLFAAAAALLVGGASVGWAAPPTAFDRWLVELRVEARASGIGDATLDAALTGIEPIPRIIKLDRSQPEGRLTAAQYLERVVPRSRIDAARTRLARHRPLLDEVADRYGVQPRFIVALWGIETDFGRNTGGFSVIEALATLAYDGRRSAFFRGELLNALKIIDDGHISAHDMTGSWAGAMGQSQFMPSSFLSFAVDRNADGRRDIWTTLDDVFASIANYLSSVGWKGDQTWGRAVNLPNGFDSALLGLETVRPIGGWQALGVRRHDGGDLPARQLSASIVRPDGAGTPAYMVYDNFKTTLKWNRSTYFALAVGHLADAMVGP